MACITVVMLILVGSQILRVSPAMAATINDISVTCRFVSVSGKTEVNAPYVRVQVVLGSNLTTVLAQQVVSTRPRAGASYTANLDIRKAHLVEGTHLVISVGEWDGTKYLRPATITGSDCNRNGGTNTQPTPAPSPTMVETLPPTYTPGPSPTFVGTLPPATPTPIASPTFVGTLPPPPTPAPTTTPRPY